MCSSDLAARLARRIWPVLVAVVGLFVILTLFYNTKLLFNYLRNPLMFILLAVPVTALILLRRQIGRKDWWYAWGLSAVVIAGLTLFGVVGLYPAILPSSIAPEYSITVTNAASSTLTLSIMLGVALIFVPVVAAYQFWLYRTWSVLRNGGGDDPRHGKRGDGADRGRDRSRALLARRRKREGFDPFAHRRTRPGVSPLRKPVDERTRVP